MSRGCTIALLLTLTRVMLFAQLVTIPGVRNGTVAWGDFDADGDLDLLVTGQGSSSPIGRVYRTEGGVFTSFLDLSTEFTVFAESYWGDFDHDGKLDVLVSTGNSAGEAVTRVLLNRRGEFMDAGIALPGLAKGWHDANGDGRLEILVNSPDRFSRLYRESVSGGLELSQSFPAPVASAAWCDFDLSGTADLLLCLDSGFVQLYRLTGNRYEETSFALPRARTDADWGDADNDGDMDLLLAARNSQGNLTPKIFWNDRGLRLLDDNPFLIPIPETPALFGDWNRDGRLDAFLIGPGEGQGNQPLYPVSRVFRNLEGGAFIEFESWMALEEASASIADHDRNGGLELAMTGVPWSSSSPPVFSLRRAPTGALGHPLSPFGLNARTKGDRVVLDWSRPEMTHSGGWTFSLRVGTRPGTVDIISPLARENGSRMVPGPGNAGSSTRWRLRDLAPGTYYWSVQSVDQHFTGSPFAAEGQFTTGSPLADQPVIISAIPHQEIQENAVLGPLRFTVNLDDVQLWAKSSNTNLLPVEAIELSGSGLERFLTLQPISGRSGETMVTVEAETSFGERGSAAFLLRVVPVDDPPTLTGLRELAFFSDEALPALKLNVNDDYAGPPEITLNVISGDPSLIVPSVREVSWGDERWIDFSRPAQKSGTTFLTIELSDGTNLFRTNVTVTIRPPLFEWRTIPDANSRHAAFSSWGDYNRDGWLDLLLSNQQASQGGYPSYTKLLHNEAGKLVPTALLPESVNSSVVEWGDSDNDGDLDIYISGIGAGGIYRNDGDAFTFIRLPYLIHGGLAKLLDLDLDGDLDLLVGGPVNFTHFFRILRNDGSNLFNPLPVQPPVPRASWLLGTADYDADGDDDLLIYFSNHNSPQIRVFRNEGGFEFQDSGLFLGEQPDAAGWADFDSNGRPDLWTQSTWAPGALFRQQFLTLFENKNSGAFAAPIISATIGSPFGWIDLDADGDLDLVGEAVPWYPAPRLLQPAGLSLVRNDLDRWQALGSHALTNAVTGVAAGDLDRDGRQDLSLTFGDSEAVLLINQTLAVNSLPESPFGLAATTNGSSITFRWNAARDANQRSGLTYNLRVGTHPGGIDVVSPMSLENGTRLLPQPGNAGGILFRTLTNLTAESYYWSVQAVDHSFAGSPFAQESRVVLNPSTQPPLVSRLEDQTIREDTMLTNLVFRVADEKTAPEWLQVTARSSDGDLIPSAGIRLEGRGELRALSLQPATNRHGSGIITLTVTDATGLKAEITFGVHVLPVNDRPKALGGTVYGQEDRPFPIVLDGQDADGDALAYRILIPPRFGELVAASQTTLLYRPITNYFGSDHFTFEFTDGSLVSGPAQILVLIGAVPDAASLNASARLTPLRELEITLAGEPWQRYRLEWSENLTNWEFELVLQASENGRTTVLDPNFHLRQKRFFRFIPLW